MISLATRGNSDTNCNMLSDVLSTINAKSKYRSKTSLPKCITRIILRLTQIDMLIEPQLTEQCS